MDVEITNAVFPPHDVILCSVEGGGVSDERVKCERLLGGKKPSSVHGLEKAASPLRCCLPLWVPLTLFQAHGRTELRTLSPSELRKKKKKKRKGWENNGAAGMSEW